MNTDRHELITEFLRYGAVELAYSEHTLKGYRSALNAFAAYLSANLPGVDLLFITTPQLISYDQSQARALRPRSRARNIAAIRALYKWLTDEKCVLKKNPTLKLKPPALDNSRRSCPLGAVRAHLLEACDRIKVEKKGVFARALLGTMFHAGLRPDEVCKLQLGDIVLMEEGSYLVVQKGKRNKRREVPLSDDLAGWLRAWLQVRHGTCPMLFTHGRVATGRPVTQHVLRSILGEVKAIAGVRDKDLTPHSLRHSCATTLYENEVDLPVIQDILGHESIETTRKYVHPTDVRKFAAVQKLNAGNKPPTPTKRPLRAVRLLKRQHTRGEMDR